MKKILGMAFAGWLLCTALFIAGVAPFSRAQTVSPIVGSGGGGGTGTVTRIDTACSLSGGPITTTGTIQATAAPTTEAGANYAFLAADMCTTVYLSNASNQVPTIPQAGTTGFESGKFIEVCNIGAGTQTITPATSTIGGAATYVLLAGSAAAPKCVGIISNGTNYLLDQTPNLTATSPGGTSGQLQTNNGSGGFGAVPAPSGAVVGTTDSQTLTNKSIAASEVNSGTLAAAQMPALTGDCTTVAGAVATTCGYPSVPYTADSTVYIANMGMTLSTQSIGFPNNRLMLVPVFLKAGVTYTSLAITVSIAGTAASLCQMGVYNANQANGHPLTVANAGGTVACDATGVRAVTISFTPTLTGIYYLAMVHNGTPTSPTMGVSAIGPSPLGVVFGAATQTSVGAIYTSFTFGALTDLTATTMTLNSSGAVTPVIGIH